MVRYSFNIIGKVNYWNTSIETLKKKMLRWIWQTGSICNINNSNQIEILQWFNIIIQWILSKDFQLITQKKILIHQTWRIQGSIIKLIIVRIIWFQNHFGSNVKFAVNDSWNRKFEVLR